MTPRARIAVVLLAAASLAGAAAVWQPVPVAAAGNADAAAADAAANLQLYHDRVVPIFQANCYRCHGGMNHRGGFQMDAAAGMARGGHDGAVLVPGHPEQSLLIKLIRHEGPANDPMPMPPKSRISDADIAVVTAWVRGGAAMPAAPAGH